MKGKIAGRAAVVIALEGAFQGGSMGEVSGAKLTAALDLACADSEKGIPTSAVMLLETGGVRLQEANLGLAAMAEDHGIHPGASKACSCHLCHRRHGWMLWRHVACRGAVELHRPDARGPTGTERTGSDRAGDPASTNSTPVIALCIWAINGGEQRYATGLADALVEDDTQQIADGRQAFDRQGHSACPSKLTGGALSKPYRRTRYVAPMGSPRAASCLGNGRLRRRTDERVYWRQGHAHGSARSLARTPQCLATRIPC